MREYRIARGSPPRRRAFSLVELLAVVAIVGMLIALVLPAVQSSRDAARRAQCASQLRQLAVAAAGYEASQRQFPPGVEQWYFNTAVSHRGIPLFAFLLPHLEEASLLVNWDYDDPIHNADQGAQSNTAVVLPVLICPADVIPENPTTLPGRNWVYGLASYGGNGGARSYFPDRATVDGMFHSTGEASEPKRLQRPVATRDVTDGLSKTLLFGERSHVDANYKTFSEAGWGDALEAWGWWGASTSRKMIGHVTLSAHAPINYELPFGFASRAEQDPPVTNVPEFQHYIDLRLCAFGSAHSGGANFAFADGSLRFLSDDTDPAVLSALATRSSAEQAR